MLIVFICLYGQRCTPILGVQQFDVLIDLPAIMGQIPMLLTAEPVNLFPFLSGFMPKLAPVQGEFFPPELLVVRQRMVGIPAIAELLSQVSEPLQGH